MPSVLNITNGDSSVHIMRQAKITGDFLPWRDVLHEGPVPGQLSLSELSAVRAEFISTRGWGQLATILDGFTQRDNKLASCSEYDEVILWFEHDLYDQLQILQILDWFATEGPPINNLFIICNNQYLGLLSPEQMRQLLVKKRLGLIYCTLIYRHCPTSKRPLSEHNRSTQARQTVCPERHVRYSTF